MPASQTTGTVTLRLSLSALAERVDGPDGLAVRVGRHSVPLGRGPGTAPVLAALAAGVEEDALRTRTIEAGGVPALFSLQQLLQRLEQVGALARTLFVDGAPLVTLEPLSSRCPPPADAPEGVVALSRFAVVRRDGGSLLLDAARGHGRVRLHGQVGGVILAALATSTDVNGLAGAMESGGSPAGGSDADVAVGEEGWRLAASWTLRLLSTAGALTGVRDGQPDDETDPVARTWEPHDMLLHARSRVGRHAGGYGGSYRFRDALPEPPALKAPMSNDRIALPHADLAWLRAGDVPFTEVMESRRSRREHGPEPISLDQLGRFLHRSARVTQHLDNAHGEVARRIYPGGGALYELEIYPVVDRCSGLESGLYRYDPLDHALERLSARTHAVESLLIGAYHTADQRARPHVLLCVTARFGRIQWKYEAMAYAAVLKHVGVLYQTWYLVATAMGLAPCALGGGDSDLFADAAGLDWLAESSVGEFILGAPEQGTGAATEQATGAATDPATGPSTDPATGPATGAAAP